jgi:ABC-2 type transport system ATP-binding protein
VITVRGLAKRYRRRHVLENVGFFVPRGMLVGIQGENGAGKSTLLKCLVGLLKPDSGEIRMEGRIGYCPQDPSLIETLTVREQFDLFGAGYGMTPAQVERRATDLMGEFRCAAYHATRLDRLSGGTKQKVNLIAALLHEPDALILDEPYQGFDYETYQRFWEHAERFRADGGSVVVVSHMHSELARFDAMLDLAAGRVTASGRRAHDVQLQEGEE